MNDRERAELVEAAASPFRPHDPFGGIRFHPAWYDLDSAGRLEAARIALGMRRLEALLDEDGLSTTGRAVLHLLGKEDR
jgi:hypothetical protein